MSEEKAKYGTQLPEAAGATYSQRFTAMVVREFGATVGTLELSPYKQVLAQHLFIGIDAALKTAEAKRLKDGREGLPITWQNINMEKLAVDAVHRVELGLDALIPNHIHPVPYFNGKLGKYDLDLSIGYVGKDYYKREMALVKPKDIRYVLVHKTDTFIPHMKQGPKDTETYKFEINNPFERGEVVGGFGYIEYEDPTMNKLIIVPKSSFEKSKKAAKSQTFWTPHPDEMQLVCVVRRTTATIKVDPKKINASYAAVELSDAEREIQENANQGPIIDIEPEPEPRHVHQEGQEPPGWVKAAQAAEPPPIEIPTSKQGNGGQAQVPGF